MHTHSYRIYSRFGPSVADRSSAMRIIASGDILLPIVAAITLAIYVRAVFQGKGRDGRLCRKARNVIQTQSVRITLRYERAELKRILRYVKAHDVERDGRYDFKLPPRLNIWTHACATPDARRNRA